MLAACIVSRWPVLWDASLGSGTHEASYIGFSQPATEKAGIP